MHGKHAGHCPLHVTRPRCIIIDNIERMSEHPDMAGLVRVGEWSGIQFTGSCKVHRKAENYIGTDVMQGTK